MMKTHCGLVISAVQSKNYEIAGDVDFHILSEHDLLWAGPGDNINVTEERFVTTMKFNATVCQTMSLRKEKFLICIVSWG